MSEEEPTPIISGPRARSRHRLTPSSAPLCALRGSSVFGRWREEAWAVRDRSAWSAAVRGEAASAV